MMRWLLSLVVLGSLASGAARASTVRTREFKGYEFTLIHEVRRDSQTIRFNGSIMPYPQDYFAIAGFLKAVVPELRTEFVITSSGGGYMPYFEWLFNGVRKQCSLEKNECLLTTRLEDRCFSACTWLILMGDRRILNHKSALGFHREFLFFEGWTIYSPRAMTRRYTDYGVNRKWINDRVQVLFGDQCQHSGCWISAQEALEGGFATELK